MKADYVIKQGVMLASVTFTSYSKEMKLPKKEKSSRKRGCALDTAV